MCALALAAAMLAAHRWRVRQHRNRAQELQTLVEHRTRQLEELNAQLQQLSIIDSLTGIPNRRRFDEALQLEWGRSRRAQTILTLFVIDIDFFKAYNDTYGHPQGDEALRRVADVLRTVIRRSSDFVARYGGEEFAAIISGTPVDATNRIAEELRTAVEALGIRHESSRVAPVVTVSVGGATIRPCDANGPQDLVEAADDALYRAKRQGRNRSVIDTKLLRQTGVSTAGSSPNADSDGGKPA